MRLLCACVMLVLTLACAGEPRGSLQEGRWHAWLDSPGGPLPFELEITGEDGELGVRIINGDERIRVPRVEAIEDRLVLGMDHYDSRIEASVQDQGRALDGLWSKTGSGGQRVEMPFHATAGSSPRFETTGPAAEEASGGPIDGRWSVRFASDEEPAVGLFESAPDGTARGTFLTTTGDYRYLAGNYSDGLLRLSTFDGAHAFLFHARLEQDGALRGDFWSRDSWHDTWTATLAPEAELPDAFALTNPIEGVDLAQLVFPDLEGRPRSLSDANLAGRARIVELFGTWCPNCNDATRYLVELHRRYGDRGLVVVGLAFELTGDLERDTAQLRTYARHHEIEFPLLLAGRYGRDAESRSFPLIDRIRAYPTTLFLDAGGRVRAVYTGFAGPATGEAHQRLRQAFEARIEALLEEEDAP